MHGKDILTKEVVVQKPKGEDVAAFETVRSSV